MYDTFFQWLVQDRGISEKEATRYEKLVTKNTCLPVQLAIQYKIGRPGPLTGWYPEEVYALLCRNELQGREQTAVNMCLRYLDSKMNTAPKPENAAAAVSVSLKTFLRQCAAAVPLAFIDFFSTEHILRLLLIPENMSNPDFHTPGERQAFRSEHKTVVFGNLKRHRDAVNAALWKSFTQQQTNRNTNLSEQLWAFQTLFGGMAKQLNRKFASLENYDKSEIHRLLLQMESWEPSEGGAGWRAFLSDQELKEHVINVFLHLLENVIQWEGYGLAPAVTLDSFAASDQMYFLLLSSFNGLIGPDILESKQWKIESVWAVAVCLLKNGLLQVRKTADGAEAYLTTSSIAIPITPSGQASLLQQVWLDNSARNILLELLAYLRDKNFRLRKTTRAGELIRSNLTVLLDAAPSEQLLETEYIPDRQRHATINSFSDSLMTEAVSEEEQKTLQEIAKRISRKGDVPKAVMQLTEMLVQAHWIIWRSAKDMDGEMAAFDSMERLIALYRARPMTVFHIMEKMSKTERAKPAWADQSLPLFAELCGSLGRRALLLAENESLSAEKREELFLKACNNSLLAAENGDTGAYLIRAKAFALYARFLCENHENNPVKPSGLLSDYIIPCAGALCKYEQKKSNTDSGSAWEETVACCEHLLFASPAIQNILKENILKENITLWDVMPHSLASPEERQKLSEMRIAPPETKVEGIPVPEIWIPTPHPAQLFRPWYCSYLDSETVVSKQYPQEQVEAYMLKTIFSLQNIVLTANQVIDNAIIRSLAYTPGFLSLLRSGHITVSFYYNVFSLKQYAVASLRNSKFQWSSFPVDFNGDEQAQHIAADYLEDKISREQLTERYYHLMTEFKETLMLLDENLSYQYKAERYQYQIPNKNPSTLADLLNSYFRYRVHLPAFQDMCRLHTLLVNPALSEKDKSKLTRSPYRDALKGLINGELDKLSAVKDFCQPSVLEKGSEQRRWIEHLTWDVQGQALMNHMLMILNDTQNRLLGGLCTKYQHHLYSEAELPFMPYDESTPISHDGINKFQLFLDQITQTENSMEANWNQAPEFLSQDWKQRSAEQLASSLSGGALDYDISDDGNTLVLSRGHLRTSNEQSLLIEKSVQDGMTHLETVQA